MSMHRSLDYSWGLLFKNVSVQVAVERVMEVLKEFLETSTIHGLFYISAAKVSREIAFMTGKIREASNKQRRRGFLH